MMEWKECVASEFCLKVTDGTHDSPKPKEKGHYLITSKHIGKGNIDYSTANLISDEDYQKVLKRSAVEQFDILFSMIGTIGNIYRETSPSIDYAVKNMGIFKMGCDEEKSQWLYYWLQSPKAKKYIFERLAGSTQSYLTLDSLRNFPIAYPSNKQDMNRIASILSSLDRKIELNNKINAQLEEMAQALFKSWFVDFEPFKDGKFVESELGMIPEGWRVGTLGEIASITKSSINPQKTPDAVYNHYSLPAYDEGRCPVQQNGAEIMSNKIVFEEKTTLVSKLNPHIKRVWFVNQVKENPICSTEFIPVKADNDSYCSFIHCLINSDWFYSKAVSSVNGATTSHQRIHPQDIMAIKFAMRNEIALEFCDKVYPFLCKIENNIAESLHLSQLRDTLLPKLMNGEIEL